MAGQVVVVPSAAEPVAELAAVPEAESAAGAVVVSVAVAVAVERVGPGAGQQEELEVARRAELAAASPPP